VINPLTGDSVPYQALLDTGADDTVFRESAAEFLGIDLAFATSRFARGATGETVRVRYSEVFLQLTGNGGEVLEWSAVVGFAPRIANYPLLGFAGFLQFFDMTFFGESEEVELIPNGLLPARTPSIVLP